MIAFQLDFEETTDGFGIQPFGTSDFGGGAPALLALPDPEIDSDDWRAKVRQRIGESVHRRDGLIIGARVSSVRGVWRFVWKHRDRAFVDSLIPYHSARRFRFLPDSTQEGTYFLVHWVETDFPEPGVKRGGLFDVALTLQEVS